MVLKRGLEQGTCGKENIIQSEKLIKNNINLRFEREKV